MQTLPRKYVADAHSARSRQPFSRRRDILLFTGLSILGALGVLYSAVALTLLAVLAAMILTWWAVALLKRHGLELWQALLLIPLTGYMLLNYGFENITIHLGSFPIIVSYVLMYICLALALYHSRRSIGIAINEPASICFLVLLVFSLVHLLFDIPSAGLWAIRDATMVLDGLFLFLGIFWSLQPNGLRILAKWLIGIFVLNMLYCFTFPWSDAIHTWSPSSGVFLEVPIFGQYHTTDIYLLLGAVFCLGVGARFLGNRRWLILPLVILQLLGLTVTQARASYVALVACIVILILIGEHKKSFLLIGTLSGALIALVLLTGVGGLQLSGRIGPINIDFLRDHIRSITGENVTPASSVDSRIEFAAEAMQHFHSSPIFGVGFGQPIVSYIDQETGATVRIPHNSNLTVMVRLGVIGLMIWIAFNVSLIRQIVRALRRRSQYDRQVYEWIQWVLIFYATFMIAALVEGPLETPSSAIPFYFFMGLGLGLMRHRLRKTAESTTPQPLYINSPVPDTRVGLVNQ